MPPRNPPTLTLIETHRPIMLPDDWCAEHLQVEPDTPIVFTGAEVVFAAWAGGVAGVVVTVVAAFVWSVFL